MTAVALLLLAWVSLSIGLALGLGPVLEKTLGGEGDGGTN